MAKKIREFMTQRKPLRGVKRNLLAQRIMASYLQFCGRSKIESKCGVIEMEPGEIIGCKGEGGRPVRKLSALGVE